MFFVLDTLKIIILNKDTGYADIFIYNYTSATLNKIQTSSKVNSYSDITSFKCDPMDSTVKIYCVYIINKEVYLKTFSLYKNSTSYFFLLSDTLGTNPISEFVWSKFL